jgi:hypothetical protein
MTVIIGIFIPLLCSIKRRNSDMCFSPTAIKDLNLIKNWRHSLPVRNLE